MRVGDRVTQIKRGYATSKIGWTGTVVNIRRGSADVMFDEWPNHSLNVMLSDLVLFGTKKPRYKFKLNQQVKIIKDVDKKHIKQGSVGIVFDRDWSNYYVDVNGYTATISVQDAEQFFQVDRTARHAGNLGRRGALSQFIIDGKPSSIHDWGDDPEIEDDEVDF